MSCEDETYFKIKYTNSCLCANCSRVRGSLNAAYMQYRRLPDSKILLTLVISHHSISNQTKRSEPSTSNRSSLWALLRLHSCSCYASRCHCIPNIVFTSCLFNNALGSCKNSCVRHWIHSERIKKISSNWILLTFLTCNKCKISTPIHGLLTSCPNDCSHLFFYRCLWNFFSIDDCHWRRHI